MPIYKAPVPVPQVPPVHNVPTVVDTSSIFINKDHPRNVINFLDGGSWIVNYYSTILGQDDVLINSSDTTDPTIKQYVKVSKYELRVTDALTPSIDDSTGVTTIVGGANCYSVFAPMTGDVFIGTVSAGVKAIFEVVATPVRNTMYDDSSWKISYALIEYLNLDNLALLNSYVVSELVFDINRLGTNLNPLISKSENNRTFKKEELENNLIRFFYLNYFDRNFNTFLVPDESNRMIYDSHLVSFWNKLFTSNPYDYPTLYDVDFGSNTHKYHTVLDAIIHQDAAMVNDAIVHLKIVNTSSFTNVLYSIPAVRISGIEYVLKPHLLKGKPTRLDELSSPEPIPYIFSLGFYEGLNELSLFELKVKDLLNRQVLNFNEIFNLYEETMTLEDEVSKFYRIPILICLLRICR